MAETAEFFERQIDRTNYAAFWYLGASGVVVAIILSYGLYQIGTVVRHTSLPTLPSLPSLAAPNPQQALDNARAKAAEKANQAADTAATKAADGVKTKLDKFLQP